jgi:hypothetical protein
MKITCEPDAERLVSGEEQKRVFLIEEHLVSLARDAMDFGHVTDGDDPVSNRQVVENIIGEAAAEEEASVAPADESELEPAPVLDGAPEVKLLPGNTFLNVELHQAGFDPTAFWIDARPTGELRSLEKPPEGCIWAMGTTGEGEEKYTFVAHYNPTTQVTSGWRNVSDLLQLRLHRVSGPPAWEQELPEEERGLLIRDPVAGATAWRSEQRRAKTARGVHHVPVHRIGAPGNLPELKLKIWIYQIERAPSAHIMWELPRIAEVVYRGMDADGSNWVRNNLDNWPKTITGLGLQGDDQYLRGNQGATTVDKNLGVTISGLMLAQHVSEPIGTSLGVVVGMLQFAVPINAKMQRLHPDAPQQGARAPVCMCMCQGIPCGLCGEEACVTCRGPLKVGVVEG